MGGRSNREEGFVISRACVPLAKQCGREQKGSVAVEGSGSGGVGTVKGLVSGIPRKQLDFAAAVRVDWSPVGQWTAAVVVVKSVDWWGKGFLQAVLRRSPMFWQMKERKACTGYGAHLN